jgi:hypothetical protein
MKKIENKKALKLGRESIKHLTGLSDAKLANVVGLSGPHGNSCVYSSCCPPTE